MRKKPPALFLAASLVLMAMATGCGAGESETTPPDDGATTGSGDITATGCLAETETSDAEELTILGFSGPEYDALMAIGAEYEAQTGVKVTVEDIGRDGFTTRLRTRLAAGTDDFDLAFTESESLQSYADAGWLAPLDDQLAANPCFDKDAYMPSVWPAVTYQEQTFGLPFMVPMIFLFYRTDLIDTPPATFDELLAVAQQFTQSSNPDSPTKYGLGFATKAEYGYKLWYTLLNSFGGRVFDDDGNVTINEPEAVASLQYLVDLVSKDQVAPLGVVNGLYPETEALAQNGDVAMVLQWNAAAAELGSAEASPKIGGNMAPAMIPGVEQADGTITYGPYLHAQTLIVNAASAHTDEAVRFITWYNTEENARRAATEFGEFPPIASLYADPELSAQIGPSWELMGQYMEVAVATQESATKAVWGLQLSDDINQAITGQLSVQEALDLAKEQIEASSQ